MSAQLGLRRPASPEELAQMEGQWRALVRFRWKELPFALGMWALVALVLYGLWRLLGTLSHNLLAWPLGWDSFAGRGLLIGAWLAWTAWCVRGMLRQRRHSSALCDRLRKDLVAAQVEEFEHRFVAAKVFEEPEHGGLIYFLRTDRDRVYVHYDLESGPHEPAGKGADARPFGPSAALLSVQAPRSGLPVGAQWSGNALDAGEPQCITLDPERWPEDGQFCRMKWDQLDRRLAGKR